MRDTNNHNSPVAVLTTQLAAQMRAPRIVAMELILTEACNLKCSYCFEYDADRRQTMSLSTALAAVDFLIEASRNSEWIRITLMGGEPMIRFDIIPAIVRYAQEKASIVNKRVLFDMTTNGILLKEEHLRFFKEKGIRYCLSLDGKQQDNDLHRIMPNGKGVFDTIACKMPLLKRYQHWQGARMTIMPDTASRLCENIRVLHEDLRINQFVIGFSTGVVWSDQQIADYNRGLKESFEYYFEQRITKQSRRLKIGLLEVGELNEAYRAEKRRTWGCGAGSGRIAVAPEGTFHGCSKLAWAPGGSDVAVLPFGSVKTGLDRWNNRIELLDHSLDKRLKCQACKLTSSCSGGCYAANYAETGNIYLPSDTYCKLIYAQKDACDYGRKRLKELGICNLYWKDKTQRQKKRYLRLDTILR
jgi:uncharacterized protein